jgi:hypothetical protein
MSCMRQLTKEQRCAVVRCLVDGVSVRGTVRITGVSKNTIQKLTRELGEAVLQFQDNALRNIKSKRVQCDEVWAFCYAKDKNLPDAMRGMPGIGSIWTWTALDADTKLMISCDNSFFKQRAVNRKRQGRSHFIGSRRIGAFLCPLPARETKRSPTRTGNRSSSHHENFASRAAPDAITPRCPRTSESGSP